jgi:hypothetical protein
MVVGRSPALQHALRAGSAAHTCPPTPLGYGDRGGGRCQGVSQCARPLGSQALCVVRSWFRPKWRSLVPPTRA